MISIAEARLVDISGKGECCMNQEKIDRINFLARKSRTDGLTDAELALRQEYIAAFRRSLTGQLDNTWIVDEKGNKRKLERRPGVAKKKTAAVEPMPLKVNMENNGKKTADE